LCRERAKRSRRSQIDPGHDQATPDETDPGKKELAHLNLHYSVMHNMPGRDHLRLDAIPSRFVRQRYQGQPRKVVAAHPLMSDGIADPLNFPTDAAAGEWRRGASG